MNANKKLLYKCEYCVVSRYRELDDVLAHVRRHHPLMAVEFIKALRAGYGKAS